MAINYSLKALIEKPLVRRNLLVTGLVLVMFLMLWARAFYGSVKAYHKGEDFLKQENYIRAITYFDRSIHWYTPLNPYVRKSAERLWEIGEKAQEIGDNKLALIAYRTVRSGFYATSHFIIPYKEWIERAEARIATLVEEEQKDRGVSEDIASIRDSILESQKARSPDVFWTIVLEVGLMGWIGSIIGFIMLYLKKEGASGFFRISTLKWLGLTAPFFFMWIIGMMRA
ncbi:MAG: hypothetical protein JRJ29_13885 [Deltaproteobacteria bacterium]|nr:hypothetical protein [Deltaproteobacteria bacterium]